MFRINKAHPWHGVPIGAGAPAEVTIFVEIVPSDTVKYEVDKETGYLMIDRPQQYSNGRSAAFASSTAAKPMIR